MTAPTSQSSLAHGDLYLVDDENGIVFTCSRDEGSSAWRSDRPVHMDAADRWRIRHDGTGWVVEEPAPRGRRPIVRVSPAPGLAQDGGDRPPLGPWHGKDGRRYTLQDREPALPPLGLPVVLDSPFASVHFRQTNERVVSMELRARAGAVEDEAMESLFSQAHEILYDIVRRPRLVLLYKQNLNEMSLPPMRQVKRFINFHKDDAGLALFLLCRANAVVMNSAGPMLRVVKMVQMVLSPPWEQVIKSTDEGATQYFSNILKDFSTPMLPISCAPGTAEEANSPEPSQSPVSAPEKGLFPGGPGQLAKGPGQQQKPGKEAKAPLADGEALLLLAQRLGRLKVAEAAPAGWSACFLLRRAVEALARPTRRSERAKTEPAASSPGKLRPTRRSGRAKTGPAAYHSASSTP